MDRFKRYNHIWQKEKEDTIMTFIAQNPLLSEFESRILYFQSLEQEINAEPEYIRVGSIALYTGWSVDSDLHVNPAVLTLSLYLD